MLQSKLLKILLSAPSCHVLRLCTGSGSSTFECTQFIVHKPSNWIGHEIMTITFFLHNIENKVCGKYEGSLLKFSHILMISICFIHFTIINLIFSLIFIALPTIDLCIITQEEIGIVSESGAGSQFLEA